MNLTLSDIYGEGKTLFPKYPEPIKDLSNKDEFDFYAGEYGPHVIHTEEARILPVIGNDIKVLIGEGALNPKMIDYYKNTFPETFTDKNILSYTGTDYYNYIMKNVRNKTLVTLHPYTNLDHEKYYIAPQLTYDLNNKKNIGRLTKSIPKHIILLLDEIKQLTSFPFVLKASSGASGDGVRIIKNHENLSNALIWFSKEESLIVEEYIDYVKNNNIQLFISKNGNISIIGSGEQNVTEEGVYDGNYIDLDSELEEGEKQIVLEVGKNAYNLGFYGICGLDILKSSDGNFYLIDPNFRLNGSTSTLLLKERIKQEKNKNFLRFGGFKSNHSDIDNMIKSNLSLKGKSIYLLSSYNNKALKIISGYGIIVGSSKEEIDRNTILLEKKGFKF